MLPQVLLMMTLCQSFEVASVKPSPSTNGRMIMKSDPGRISYTNITLKRVLMSAYDVKTYQITGPDWLETHESTSRQRFLMARPPIRFKR